MRIKEGPKETGVEGEGIVSYKERYRSTVVEDERIIVYRSHRLLKTMTPGRNLEYDRKERQESQIHFEIEEN